MLTFLLIAVAIIVGASIIVGKALSGPQRRSRHRADPHDPVTALKASGALKHRKSNRN